MQIVELSKVEEPKELLQRRVPPCERAKMTEVKAGQIVKYPGGLIIYTRLTDEQLAAVRPTILQAPTTGRIRLAGLKKNSAQDQAEYKDVLFGFKPSRPVFGHTAGPVRYTVENPSGYRALVGLGETMQAISEQLIGDDFKDQMARAKKNIRPEYLMGQTGFTQGVVNRSNALSWHFDRGNFTDSYSAMLWVLQGGLAGGELMIPSLNAYAVPTDGGVIIFKGQNLIHGVAPVKKTRPGSERMSVVFYTHEALEKTGSMEDEMKKSKAREFRKHFK